MKTQKKTWPRKSKMAAFTLTPQAHDDLIELKRVYGRSKSAIVSTLIVKEKNRTDRKLAIDTV